MKRPVICSACGSLRIIDSARLTSKNQSLIYIFQYVMVLFSIPHYIAVLSNGMIQRPRHPAKLGAKRQSADRGIGSRSSLRFCIAAAASLNGSAVGHQGTVLTRYRFHVAHQRLHAMHTHSGVRRAPTNRCVTCAVRRIQSVRGACTRAARGAIVNRR
jgi:hypothetical protein